MRKFFEEAGRRSLWQVLGIYAAASWVVLQVVDQLTETAGLPDWVPPFALVLLLLGFPVVMATAFLQKSSAAPAAPPDPGAAESGTEAAAVSDDRPRGRASAPSGSSSSPDATGGRLHRLFTWRNALLGGAAAFLALAVGTWGFMQMRERGIGPVGSLVAKGVLDERAPIVIADFSSPDATVSRAATEALRVDLGQSKLVRIVEPTAVSDALSRMGRSPEEGLAFSVARDLAIREGYPAVVTGDISPVGNGYVLTARIVEAREGRTLASERATARDADGIIPAIDELSKGIRERIGDSYSDLRSDPPLEKVTTGSLEALEKYSQALRSFAAGGQRERGLSLLQEAVAIDSGFAMAWRKIGVEGKDQATRLHALEQAFEHRDRLTGRERLLSEATYWELAVGDHQKAITAYERILDADPQDAWALNNLAATYQDMGDWERAERYFAEAARADSTSVKSIRNFAMARVQLGRLDAADSALRIAVERFPEDPGTAWAALSLAYARGDVDSAAAVARRLRTGFDDPAADMMGAGILASLAASRGRIDEADGFLREAVKAHAAADFPNEAMMLAPLVWIEFKVADDPVAAARVLDEIRRTNPVEAGDPLNRPYLGVAALEAQLGHRAAVDSLLSAWEAAVPERYRSDGATRNGHLQISALLLRREGRYEDALDSLRAREPDGNVTGRTLPYAELFYEAGQADSAIAYYERYLSTPTIRRPLVDAVALGPAYERLAHLYDEKGDLEQAAGWYAKFVDLWQDADPELQPRVRAARDRLEEIARQRG